MISYLEFEERSEQTKKYVNRLLNHFKSTALKDIDQAAADRACKKLLTKAAGPATKIRAVYTPLRAILKHAASRKMCDLSIFETPTVSKKRIVFLLPEQVNALIGAAAPHLRPLITFLVGTGVRLSEALELDWRDVDFRGARAVVRQKQGNYRYLDLAPRVLIALAAMPNKDGRVFQTPAVFDKHNRQVKKAANYAKTRVSGGQISKGWSTACRAAGLPGVMKEYRRKESGEVMRVFVPEVTPHSCRHTWASAHYSIHHDLMRLRSEGGWSTTTMCERYTHLMPAAYREEWIEWFAGAPVAVERKEA